MDVPALTRRPPARAAAAAALAIGLFLFAWVYRFNDPGGSFAFLTDDHFFYLVRGWQILFGDLPVRDFVDHGAPLYYYAAAAVQLLFGRGTLSEVVFSVTVLAAGATALFLLSARASGSLLIALAATLWHVFLEPRFYNYPKVVVYVCAIAALWAFVDRPDRRRVAVIAIVTVVAFLFRHDHGVFVGAAFAALLLLMRRLSWQHRIHSAVTYALLTLLLVSPYLLFIQSHGGLFLYFRTGIRWSERDRDRANVVWPGLFDSPEGVSRLASSGNAPERLAASIGDNAVAWLYYGELALPILALAILALASAPPRRDWPHGREKIAVVAVLALLLDVGFLRSPLAARLADPSVPLTVLMAWVPAGLVAMGRRPRRLGRSRAVGRVAVGCGSVALLATMGVAGAWHAPRRLEQTAIADGIGHTLERTSLVWSRVGHSFPLSREDAMKQQNLLMLAEYIRECTGPQDRVFMEFYLPQVIALSERAFAGGQADMRPGFFTSIDIQQLTVSRLRRQHVPLVFVGPGEDLGGFRTSFPVVTAYFDAKYRSAGERSFDDGRNRIQLLVRRDAMPVRTFEPIGWPCYREDGRP